MRLLLKTLDGAAGEISPGRIAELVAIAPFMPTDLHWYLQKRDMPVRKFVADAYPKLSEVLFNATDNAVRLKLVPQIMRLHAGSVKAASKFSREERNEHDNSRRDYKAMNASYGISREIFKTHQGSAWSVCK